MADFDAIRKEVEALEARHLELSVIIPKLEEEEKGLKDKIGDLQQDVVNHEVVLENTLAETNRILSDHNKKLQNDKDFLEAERKDFERHKAEEQTEIDQQITIIKNREGELNDKQTELDTLLEQQVAGGKRLEEEMVGYAQKLNLLNDERIQIDKDRSAVNSLQNELNERERALSDKEALSEADRLKVADITAEAESALKAGRAMLKEAKERNNLVSLKEDEFNRKEVLLKDETRRLKQKEIALNDRAAVYESHQK